MRKKNHIGKIRIRERETQKFVSTLQREREKFLSKTHHSEKVTQNFVSKTPTIHRERGTDTQFCK